MNATGEACLSKYKESGWPPTRVSLANKEGTHSWQKEKYNDNQEVIKGRVQNCNLIIEGLYTNLISAHYGLGNKRYWTFLVRGVAL